MKPQKRPRTTPTFKQKLFAKKYIEHNGNASKAAMEVYDAEKSEAKNIGYINLQKPIVQETIQRLLDKSGLAVDNLNDYSQKAIELALTRGKPTFAAGVSMLQFMYKLHNVIPAKQSMHVSVSRSERLQVKTYDETKKGLEEQQKASERLLQDLK